MKSLLKSILQHYRDIEMVALYWPHLLVWKHSANKTLIEQDVIVNAYYSRITEKDNEHAFCRLMRSNRYFRTLFFFRVGKVSKLLWGGQKTLLSSPQIWGRDAMSPILMPLLFMLKL